MNLEVIMPFVIMALVVVILLLARFYERKQKIIRELKKSPSKPINTVKDKEYVRVHGNVEVIDQPLIAPLSGRPCVYYHIRVEQKGDKSWIKVIDDFKHQDFYLSSGSERCRVNPGSKSASLVFLETDHQQKSGWRNDASPKVEAYLSGHGKSSKTRFFDLNKTMRYKEAILEPGEAVVVKGVANWLRLDEPLEGFSYSRLLELSGEPKNKLIVTDLPKALKILPKRK